MASLQIGSGVRRGGLNCNVPSRARPWNRSSQRSGQRMCVASCTSWRLWIGSLASPPSLQMATAVRVARSARALLLLRRLRAAGPRQNIRPWTTSRPSRRTRRPKRQDRCLPPEALDHTDLTRRLLDLGNRPSGPTTPSPTTCCRARGPDLCGVDLASRKARYLPRAPDRCAKEQPRTPPAAPSLTRFPSPMCHQSSAARPPRLPQPGQRRTPFPNPRSIPRHPGAQLSAVPGLPRLRCRRAQYLTSCLRATPSRERHTRDRSIG
mmetsp:Transcript_84095/g.271123  ORF Transcript_84095/g.271123 Transcript_84095/m.271123 type:complete len:265 (+) Transcript_84095:87-881(+)